jgi:RNase H-like domain found in reverse transcriptase/Reverse transcriptase (RNA-dependent DNA polymerase)/Integrase zinc binding domain
MGKLREVIGPPPPVLPPLRAINHDINFIDEDKVIHYHMPRCPDALKDQLSEKIDRYTSAGWWIECTTPSAAPMLCLRKKTGKLRTVIDARKRNDNTVKDVTPFPDQDRIRHDLARAKFRSKLDMTDAYEQIRINPDHVHKTAFSTTLGTYKSMTMQQGDCNAPSTFQRLMTYIFRKHIGKGIYVYLDDIFIYSDTIEEHERLLEIVLQLLKENKLYLSENKIELYASNMECLGHRIDEQGLHADEDKFKRIREWKSPTTYKGVQQFLGLVNYVADFLPEISAWTTPLSGITRNKRSFHWSPLHEKCFESIKNITSRNLVLKPIDPKVDQTIWVICDASVGGIGAYYGQGETWETCRPAGFLSRKFTKAQMSYRTYEQETIAILEALMKWEDKLLGRKFTVVTDHKALEFFSSQKSLSYRQVRWWEYLSRFEFQVKYIEGKLNKVADSLSRYFENDTPEDKREEQDFVSSDQRLDPEGETLPIDRLMEVRVNASRQKKIRDPPEARKEESNQMNEKQINHSPVELEEDPLAIEAIGEGELPIRIEGHDELIKTFKKGYKDDSLFKKVKENPKDYPKLQIEEGIIYATSRAGRKVICIPDTLSKKRRVREIVIDHAHRILGHRGTEKTTEYIRRWYWWPSLIKDTDAFCKTCPTCSMTKSNRQKPTGMLHNMPIPERPWESIGIDFVGPFPKSMGFDYMIVVICRLTSMVHLIPTTTKVKASEVAWLYLKEIVRLHGIADSIISDRDPKFTSIFWKELHRLVGTKLMMSTAFHPQTDGATERAIRSISEILRSVVDADQTNWVEKCPMVEFAINSSISSSSKFSPFELNYGYIPPMIRGTHEGTTFVGVDQFVDQARVALAAAHDAIIASRINQTHQSNKGRNEEKDFTKGDKVYLSTKNLSLPKQRAHKLLPRFVGPYQILEAFPEQSTYKLKLPSELEARRIHPVFHASLLRPYYANNDKLFPRREVTAYYDFGQADDAEYIVDEIIDHKWKGKQLHLLVHWSLGDSTWEPLKNCEDLEALQDYLALAGVELPKDLPKKSLQK